MEWSDWEGKQVFVRTKHDKVYSGIVNNVQTVGSLTFIMMIDKFGMNVTIVHSEIVEIKEEG